MASSFAYYAMLVLESVVGVVGIRLYEEPAHSVIERDGAIEIRRYAPRVAAEVALPKEGEAGRNDAFQLLFEYIAGANGGNDATKRIAMTTPVAVREPQRIAMTAPVQTREGEQSGFMRFFLPVTLSLATAPAPSDPRVRIVEVPEETLAVLRFSGLGKDSDARRQELEAWISRSGWQARGPASMFFYDAPFTIPFLRRNEAVIPVERRSQK